MCKSFQKLIELEVAYLCSTLEEVNNCSSYEDISPQLWSHIYFLGKEFCQLFISFVPFKYCKLILQSIFTRNSKNMATYSNFLAPCLDVDERAGPPGPLEIPWTPRIRSLNCSTPTWSFNSLSFCLVKNAAMHQHVTLK